MEKKNSNALSRFIKSRQKISGLNFRKFLHFLKKELKIPTKRITYTAILSSISVALVILVTTYTPLVAYPGFRIAFEGILIKIGGFAFGPLVGVLMGIVTEILVLLLRPNFIQPGYTIAILLYGLFGGLCKILSHSKKLKTTTSFWTTTILFIFTIIGLIILLTGPQGLAGSIPIFSGNSQGGGVSIPGEAGIVLIVLSIAMVSLFYFGIILFFRHPKRKSKLQTILPIFFLSVLTEYFVAVLITPWADIQALGIPITYSSLFLGRLIIAPFELAFNTIIIYFVWKTLASLLRKAEDVY